MENHSYKILEFDKIRNLIAENSVIDINKEFIENLSPMKEIGNINNELSITRDFIDMSLYDGGFETAGLKDICSLVDKIKLIGTYLDPDDLWDINFNLRVVRVFKNKIDELNKYKKLQDILKNLPNLKVIEDHINKILDNEKQIKDEASLDLRDIRLQKKALNNNIKRKFEELFENSSVANAFQEKIITTRDGRFVAPVKYDFKGLIKGIEHDKSTSGQTVFIEPLSIVSLNNKMRELDTKEKEEIRKILLRITEIIRNNSDDIKFVGEKILYLDFLNAKTIYSIDNKCNIPNINNKEFIFLENARHPFIDKNVVVPLTFGVGQNYNTLLISGPNTGGKTVALKTAGLLSLMALSGIPIPASENSSIGVFDYIFADIGDEQSIHQNLSSFSSHLKNLTEIFKCVTKNSLVLIDELGSGTDPVEGSAFAMSCIDFLNNKKVKSIITTHYSEVKVHGYNSEGVETASMEFNTETLSPTYKLLLGIPGESNALTIAKKLGFNDEVIEKAKSYISEDNKKIEKMIENIKNKSDELDLMKIQISNIKEEIENEKEKLKNEKLNLEREKNEILRKSYEDAERMINEMRSKASALVEKIQKEENKKEELKNLQKNLNMISVSIREEKNKNIQENKKIKIKVDFKEGDRIFIKSLNQYAHILKINHSKESVTAQAGILKLEVPFKDVKVELETPKKTYNTISSHKKINVRSEIDLRGKMVDEAIHELETYLDRAVLNSYSEVYIIHGKGTGALRDGILKYLKNSKYVKNYRIGGHGEGGLGCTVVTLA